MKWISSKDPKYKSTMMCLIATKLKRQFHNSENNIYIISTYMTKSVPVIHGPSMNLSCMLRRSEGNELRLLLGVTGGQHFYYGAKNTLPSSLTCFVVHNAHLATMAQMLQNGFQYFVSVFAQITWHQWQKSVQMWSNITTSACNLKRSWHTWGEGWKENLDRGLYHLTECKLDDLRQSVSILLKAYE